MSYPGVSMLYCILNGLFFLEVSMVTYHICHIWSHNHIWLCYHATIDQTNDVWRRDRYCGLPPWRLLEIIIQNTRMWFCSAIVGRISGPWGHWTLSVTWQAWTTSMRWVKVEINIHFLALSQWSSCSLSVVFFHFQNVIISQLWKRYQKQQIYTYVGDILISINPFQKLNIYSEKVCEQEGCNLLPLTFVYHTSH
jgi:hypothetical protein